MKSKKIGFLITCVFILLFLVFGDFEFSLGNKSEVLNNLIVNFIDIGQGDSIFLEFDGKTMLIDAGEENESNKVIDFIKDKNYERIDYLIGTHPHSDHIGGLSNIINKFDVGTIYMPKVVHTTKTYENLLSTISGQGKIVKRAKDGVSVISENNIEAVFLSPVRELYNELNNYSAVLKFTYGNVSFLFMGDAESLVENEITGDIRADVIKVAHHGSDTSSTLDFVNKVKAKYAVIMVGKDNQYDLPNSEIIKRWESIGAEIYRTDSNGNIIFVTDGNNIDITMER